MSIIQVIILSLLGLSLLMAFMVMRRFWLGRLFFMGQFVVGGFFVLFPDSLSAVARKLGIGRGTDLLLYFLVILFYMTVLLAIHKFRRIEQKQSAILRELAILNARKPADASEAQRIVE